MAINAVKKNSEQLIKELSSLGEQELAQLVVFHNRQYFVLNDPLISDDAFDKLVEALKIKNPYAEALLEIGAKVENTFGQEVIHQRPMLSLDKCYDDETFYKWAEKINGSLVAMPKIDGVASSLLYDPRGNLYNASTRGDGRVGEDITKNVRMIDSIVQNLDHDVLKDVLVDDYLEIRGEIFLPLSRFNQLYAEQFANPRNLAAGALKNKESEKSKSYGLSFFPYDIRGCRANTEAQKFLLLEKLGFVQMPWCLVPEIGRAHEIFKKFSEQRLQLDYEIDGVVFRANEIKDQNRLGETAHHPRFAIAYKFQTESMQTALVDIEWSVSRTGAITPVAIVKPVFLSGATITRASLHNLGIFRTLGLHERSLLEINRRGGVIPHVERVLSASGALLEPPSLCPSCQSELVIEGDFLLCINKDCVASVVSSLIHFCHVLNLEGFGEKLLRKLFENGLVQNFADIFRLKKEQLMNLERMGEVLAKKLLGEIEQKREVDLAVFLRALGISDVGNTISEILAANFHSLETIRKLTIAELMPLHGIGERIATSLVAGLQRHSAEITDLLLEIRVRDYVALKSLEDSEHILFGKSVVFTGKMAHLDRKSAQNLVKKLGGNTPASITAKTDYLVIGDEGSHLLGQGSKSTKQKDAEKLISAGSALRIISESEFLRLAHQ